MAGPRLTVAQLLPALEGGGVERGTLEIGAALVEAGHRALVVSAGGAMVAELEASGAEHHRLAVGAKSPRSLLQVPRLGRWLRDQGVDVVHARSRVPAWIAWLALRRMPPAQRPRFVTTVHGFYRVGRYSAVMTRGERVICVSQAIRSYVTRHYPEVAEAALVTIPRGVDPARFPHGHQPDDAWLAQFRASLGAPPGRALILLPGRITRLKGHEAFIDAIAALVGEGVDVHGVVAGGTDPRRRAYAHSLRERVAALDLAQRISFIGHRDDLREVMAASDVVVSLSSKPESFGRTVLESLSLGRPTVGFDHGGVGEILAALYPAGRVAPGDDAALLTRLREFLTMPPEVPRGHDFTLARMQRDTLAVYDELMASR